jgi:hypothetical protein
MRQVVALAAVLACTPDKGETETAGATTTGVTSATTAGTTGTTGAESTGDEPTTDPDGSSGTDGGPEMKCLLLGLSEAFTTMPALAGGEDLDLTCTVNTAEPIALHCDGVPPDVAITLTATFLPDLVVGESVTLEYRSVGHAEFLEQWLRIKAGTATKLVTAQAMAVAPAGVTEWFPTNVDVVPAEIGCPDVMCTDGSGLSIRKQSLVFGEGPTTIELEPGNGGVIPGEFGGETYRAFVHEARIGACGASLGEQTSWYAFSIVRTAGP